MKLYTLLVYFFSIVNGHMFMKYPFARRSKYSEYYVQNNLIDYNLDAPLYTQDFGFTFPCKGFPVGPSTLTLQSNKINIEIAGTAPHEGGHCQFGISYDNKNFIVLKQVIGSCLKNNERNYIIDLPLTLPNDNFIIFWTWINAIGNREYYMDCADIRININTPNPSYVIEGKELVIVNIPGYKIIPEFPNTGMYDGRELLLQAKTSQINICSNCVPNTQVISKTTILPSSSQVTQIPTILTSSNFIPKTSILPSSSQVTKIPSTITPIIPSSQKTTEIISTIIDHQSTTIISSSIPTTQFFITTKQENQTKYNTKTNSFTSITNITIESNNQSKQIANNGLKLITCNMFLIIMIIVSGHLLI